MSSQHKQILIIDDASDIQALLALFLRGEGYKIDKASNGRDALSFLKATSNLPGLILLDIMMPEMDGYEFREAQLKDPRIADIPVIIMTADNNIQSIAVKCGVRGYLRKPFANPDVILKAVGEYVRQ